MVASVRIALPDTAPLNITVNPLTEDERTLILPPSMRRGHTVNPTVIIPGYGTSAHSYSGLRDNLLDSLPAGSDVTVVPLKTWSWAAAVGGRPVTKILSTVDATVRATLRRTGASHVNLVGHSAGGWIARLYLGDAPYPDIGTGKAWQGRTHVRQLVCLGTPHVSGEPVAKRNMSFVNTQYPGAFYESVEYVNFGGDAVAVPISMKHIPHWQFWQPLWMARLSYYLTDPLADKDLSHVGDGKFSFNHLFMKLSSAVVIAYTSTVIRCEEAHVTLFPCFNSSKFDSDPQLLLTAIDIFALPMKELCRCR